MFVKPPGPGATEIRSMSLPSGLSTQMLAAPGASGMDDAYNLPDASTAIPSGLGQSGRRFGPKFWTTPIGGRCADTPRGTIAVASDAKPAINRHDLFTISPSLEPAGSLPQRNQPTSQTPEADCSTVALTWTTRSAVGPGPEAVRPSSAAGRCRWCSRPRP